MSRTVVWYSCGAASAVAAKLVLRQEPDAVIAYCETGSEHPDNERFLRDCEAWFGKAITRLHSAEYADTWDVWERRRYLAGISGAPCTVELKVGPRLIWQQPTDRHVFGYTFDKLDVKRAVLLRENYPELSIRTPLIDEHLNKGACLAILQSAGLKTPILYDLGFQNNNCIPCVKATSPAYWALIREHFPEQFERMSRLSRELGVRLCRIKGERAFIDEIPLDQPTKDPIVPTCDFLCSQITQELEAAE